MDDEDDGFTMVTDEQPGHKNKEKASTFDDGKLTLGDLFSSIG